MRLGFQLGRYEFIGFSDFKETIEPAKECLATIIDIAETDGWIVDNFTDYPSLIKNMLKHYSNKDLDKTAAILIGLCCFRLSLRHVKEEYRKEFSDIAKSAINDIDHEIVPDKEKLFIGLLSIPDYTITSICGFLAKNSFENDKKIEEEDRKTMSVIFKGSVTGPVTLGNNNEINSTIIYKEADEAIKDYELLKEQLAGFIELYKETITKNNESSKEVSKKKADSLWNNAGDVVKKTIKAAFPYILSFFGLK